MNFWYATLKNKQNQTKPKEEHEQDKEIKQKGFLN